MIREWMVEEAHSKRLVNFMKSFEQATSFVKVDVDYAFDRYYEMMKRGSCRIFIDEEGGEIRGAIGFIIAPDLHDGTLTAVETFWFVHPDHRGIGKDLFDVFEKTAREAGCGRTAMIHLADSYPETLERFYISKGYKLLEKHYVKYLKEEFNPKHLPINEGLKMYGEALCQS